jgi:hypothetical protein
LIKQCVGTCIVTHRGPTSPQRHEPPPRISASYRCTLISEEPVKLNQAGQRRYEVVLQDQLPHDQPTGYLNTVVGQRHGVPREELFISRRRAVSVPGITHG